jgi:hypothetical protein
MDGWMDGQLGTDMCARKEKVGEESDREKRRICHGNQLLPRIG